VSKVAKSDMTPRAPLDIKLLQERLGYTFQKPELLMQALTHRSHSKKNNERLEFLGDSVLNCTVAEMLYERYSDLDEGDLSRVRANLVKQQALYEIAQALQLSDCLRLGEGELKSGGFKRPSILADSFEAIVGAIFLDSGFEASKAVLRKWYSQYNLSAVIADVLIILIGLIITRAIYYYVFDSFSIVKFVILAVIIQIIHDLLFYIIFSNIPRGVNKMIDTFKDYANEISYKAILGDSCMMIMLRLR
jgi:23S rRNA maturation mini-RNase III